MYLHKILAALALCLIASLAIGVMTPDTHAQLKTGDSDASRSVDKDRATKRGVSGALADGSEEDLVEGDGPTKLQMALGLGSIPVMIIVVKWL